MRVQSSEEEDVEPADEDDAGLFDDDAEAAEPNSASANEASERVGSERRGSE